MNAKAFFNLVADMRKAQRLYLSTRDYGDLQRMRNLEVLVDGEIHRVTNILSNQNNASVSK